jgi:hypothetical protein
MRIQQLVETKYGNNIYLSSKGLVELPNNLPQTITDSFYCNSNHLTSLEHCPSQVGGGFYCSDNQLTSLEHCPSKVGGGFYCSCNKLTSLEGCPSQVGGDFYCSSNKLTSLEGCPSQVGGDFWCHENKLTSLHNVHKRITKIGGGFECYHNPIQSHILGLMMIDIGGEITTRLGNGTNVDGILNKWKKQGRKGTLGAQRELLELGYKELAQL